MSIVHPLAGNHLQCNIFFWREKVKDLGKRGGVFMLSAVSHQQSVSFERLVELEAKVET